MAEESYIEDTYDDAETYDNSRSDYSSEGNAAVMKNFFDMQTYIKKKIAYWQGFTIINGKKIRTHEAIAPDSFIFSIIGIIDSVLSQHNSVSYTKEDSAKKILYESITALNQSVLNEPLFNDDRYLMLVEEFDHMLELFMGLVINGHGKLVATALQAGVVSENLQKENKTGLWDKAKGVMQN